MDYLSPDPLLDAEDAATECGISVPTLWRQVAAGALPEPLYPSPRSARWRRSELIAALEKTRARPRDQMARRRVAHLAAARESATTPKNS